MTDKSAQRLIFVNRFYWPDEPATAQLLADLATSLADRGIDVTVIASNPGSSPRAEIKDAVQIRRVRGTRWARRGAIGKITDFATFYLSAMWALLSTIRRNDLVVVLTDPPLIGIGVGFVSRLCGARLIHWAQDIYPEVAITLTGHRWLGIFRPLRNLAWRSADACVTLGRDMAGVLRAAGVKDDRIAIIPNWAPAGLTPQPMDAARALRTEWNLKEKFVVLYSGNLGRVHDLDPLLDVAALLQDQPEIVFLFIGAAVHRALR